MCAPRRRGPPTHTPPNTDNGYEHWNYTFDKLLLWGLTDYDKIVYLDADMMVLDNIDHLFARPDFSAVAAGRSINSQWTRLNSGTLVIEPSEHTCRRLLSQVAQTAERYRAEGSSVGDQDVINDYLPTWPSAQALHLPEDYNLFFKHLTAYHHLGYKYGDNIKVIHFIGQHKPWHDGRVMRRMRQLKLIKDNPYGLRAYSIYLSLLP